MAVAKRVVLFLVINVIVILTLSLVLNILHVQPFLRSYGLDMPSLLIFCLVWGMGGALISLSLSRKMATWLMGVRILDPASRDTQEHNLVVTVQALARQAHLPEMPQVGIFDSPEPNAFATGPTKRRSLVAVSTGLLRRMSQKELEGVLAHEISHIANGDMVTMTLIQGIVNAFVMFLARVLAYAFSGMGRSRENSSSSHISYMLSVFFFEIVFMIFGSMVICFFSRYREFRADKGGADLAGKEKMISALESLQRLQQIRDPALAKPSFQSFKISTPARHGFLRLLSTHPPLEERIDRLRQL
ncbi:MAG TPA: protease HtpX [Rhabdochlamydiaceae bacterium]